MLNEVVVMNHSHAQFLRRTSVASEMVSVHQILRVISIAIAIERRRAAMRTEHQLVAVIELRLLT